MPTAAAASGQQSQVEATLDAGIAALSQDESVTFRLYTKMVLSQDGYVFWVASQQYIKVQGSIHVAADREQSEDETIGANQVIFSSKQQVSVFNAIAPQTMWIGSWPTEDGTPPLRIAFARRSEFYDEAGVWHYAGFAVYPVFEAQIVDSPADLPAGPIVSNSLPIWLAQMTYNGNTVAVYPSFLVPDNIRPPYVVAHIDRTEALTGAPIVGPFPGEGPGNALVPVPASQLYRDEVVLTLYGFNNAAAWQYLVALYEVSRDYDVFGWGNSPAIVDEKRKQTELAALAQKKTISISASYFSGTADAIARRLLLSASITTTVVRLE